MPIVPRGEETRDSFIQRCLETLDEEGKFENDDNTQQKRLAMCYSNWREAKEKVIEMNQPLPERFEVLEKGVSDDGRHEYLCEQEDDLFVLRGPDILDKGKQVVVQNDKLLAFDVGKEEPDVEGEFNILKTSSDKQVCTGRVMKPNFVDAQNDNITQKELEEAAWRFLKNKPIVALGHEKALEDRQAYVCESYIAPTNFELNDETVEEGTWIASVKVEDDQLWQAVKEGEITGFSIGGYGERVIR